MEGQLASFIAATSIVSGVLVVWAQLWGGTASDYASRNESTSTAEVGLALCYLGAWSGLFALAAAIASLIKGKDTIPPLAMALFLFALILVFWEVLQSLISVTLRLRGERILGPTKWAEKILRPTWVRCTIMVLVFLAAAVVLVVGIITLVSA